MAASTPLFHHDTESPVFTLGYSAVLLGVVAVLILWQRRYGRMWQQFRARGWRQVVGNFDDGEVITMRKARSGITTGYKVWLGYEYAVEGEQGGLYTLPFSNEFPSEEEAEECRKLVANQNVVVRVSPRNPKRSCVLDEDVMPLLSNRGLSNEVI